MLLGEPVLIGRGRDGRVFALRDICPHRGIRLHYGRFDGDTIACCYHGGASTWGGGCVEIRIAARGPGGSDPHQHPLRHLSVCGAAGPGVGFIFPARTKQRPNPCSPRACRCFPMTCSAAAIMQPFPCSTDHAAFGLMDPTHAGFDTPRRVKHQATKLRPEEAIERIQLGWRMVRHRLLAAEPDQLLGCHVETHLLQAPGTADRRGAWRSLRRRNSGLTADHADHRRGDRGASDILGLAGMDRTAGRW